MRRRFRINASGFTLVELLVVLVVLGALAAIGVPSMISARARAEVASVRSDLRAARPYLHFYFEESGTYVGATTDQLRLGDSSFPPNVTVVSASDSRYCLAATVGGQTRSLQGPRGTWYTSGNCSGVPVAADSTSPTPGTAFEEVTITFLAANVNITTRSITELRARNGSDPTLSAALDEATSHGSVTLSRDAATALVTAAEAWEAEADAPAEIRALATELETQLE